MKTRGLAFLPAIVQKAVESSLKSIFSSITGVKMRNLEEGLSHYNVR